MTTTPWRCFVAVPISAELRESLAPRLLEWQMRPDLAGLRWTDPAAWHVTLAFLGATDPDHVPHLADALNGVVHDVEAITLATGGLGGFPSASKARVAWYGIADPDRRFRDLAKRVRRAVGSPEHQPFRPHLTLARARGGPVSLRSWMAQADPPAGSLLIDRLELMRSHRGGGPARYEPLAVAELGAVSHV